MLFREPDLAGDYYAECSERNDVTNRKKTELQLRCLFPEHQVGAILKSLRLEL